MFTRVLNNLILSSPAADYTFKNISGDKFEDDSSFVATLRALLFPRIGVDPENGALVLDISGSVVSKSYVREKGFEQTFKSVILDRASTVDHDAIMITNLNCGEEDRDEIFKVFDDEVNGFVPFNLANGRNYKEIQDVRMYLDQYMKTRIYVNEDKRMTLIIVDNMNIKKYHLIQGFIPRLIPWHFKDRPLSEREQQLLYTLTKRTADDYSRAVDEIGAEIDMREGAIRGIVGDFEQRSREAQLHSIRENIGSVRNRIADLMRQYKDYMIQIDDMHIRETGLMQIISGAKKADSELIDYLIANKAVVPIRARNHNLEMIIKTHLVAFDPDMYERYSKDGRSSVFTGYSIDNEFFRDRSKRKRLMDSIFSSEPTLKVRMCGYYKLDIRGDADSQRHYDFGLHGKDYIPNPHLNEHDCLGNHERYIRDRLIAGDIIGAISQCISSVQSMNFAESVTTQYFFRKLFSTNEKVIELPDGTCVSPKEAYKWLEDNKKSA